MLKGIDIGKMDVRITIRSFTYTPDPVTNEQVRTYSVLATVSAQEISARSDERFEASQQVAVTTRRFKIRRRTDLSEQMRADVGTTAYEIRGIEDFGRQGFMILTVEKRDNG